MNRYLYKQPTSRRAQLHWAVGIILLVTLTLGTSIGVAPRLEILIANSRFVSFAIYLSIWSLCIAALIIAAAQPSRWIRWFWAIVLSATLALSQLYYTISGSELTVFDILSLWSAKHEAGRALERYYQDAAWPLAIFAFSLVLMISMPAIQTGRLRKAITLVCWIPLVPIIIIAGVLTVKGGSGAQALPQQFAPLGVSITSLAKVASAQVVTRRSVQLSPANPPAVKHIVMLVDESIRGDYLDFQPDNPYTPVLASLSGRIANFGPAASASNCSHYSNALLRLGGTREDTIRSVTTNPPIWEYAHRAGFRTVFIDAQAAINKIAGRLQNFMTLAETQHIDRFVTFVDTPTPMLDFKLLEVVAEELRRNEPVFIYANKNGAHFPYDHGYPKGSGRFGSQEMVLEKTDLGDLIESYRNNIAWTVDEFFSELEKTTDLSDALVFYTSDHGQNFEIGKQSHCSARHADPREGLVPMFVWTDNLLLRAQYKSAASRSWGTTSHFQIAPTVLVAMGYDREVIANRYGPTLLDHSDSPTRFSSGDIFGLFSETVYWNPLDLKRDYLEPYAKSLTRNSKIGAVRADNSQH